MLLRQYSFQPFIPSTNRDFQVRSTSRSYRKLALPTTLTHHLTSCRFYHAYGQAYFCVIGPARGTPVYIMPKFDFIQMLENVQKFKITAFVLVPPVAVALAKHPASKNYDLSSITTVGSGAAPLSRAVSEEVENLWPPGVINFKVLF